MKLVVGEPESEALRAAIADRGPHVTSVIGEIETRRVWRRAGLPDEEGEALRRRLIVLAVDDDVQRLATAAAPSLRTLDAIHLATALSLGDGLEALVTYDRRLAEAGAAAGVPILAP